MNESEITIKNVARVLQLEAAAVTEATTRVGKEVVAAIDLLDSCRGRLVLTGMGKAGAIARKAAATFCSTGAPAVFLHPAEAVHGDLGIIGEGDVVIALSNSGETQELLSWLPFLQRQGTSLIALTGNLTSSLAANSNTVIDTHVDTEADPLELAPTSSTTVMLAMCDALAIALMQRRGFTKEQFAIFHPGGNLGRKLLLTVADLMRSGDSIPCVPPTSTLQLALNVISEKNLGCVFVASNNRRLQGVLTDGDVRRLFFRIATDRENDLPDVSVEQFMTRPPKSITADTLAAEAIKRMEDHQITAFPVIDNDERIIGVLHLHDLIRAGLA